MPHVTKWFDRKFEFGIPPEMLPLTIERLRGTPARLEERLFNVPQDRLTRKLDDSWSIQEHAGHLFDLEELWTGRVEDLRRGKAELRIADLQNTKTHQANHNSSELADILKQFRAARLNMVTLFEHFEESALAHTVLHPRLKVPMTITDHAFFVAEHDDHHLAAMTRLLK